MKGKSKTRLIVENRDARMFLDELYRKVKAGEFGHIYSLVNNDHLTQKVNNEWESIQVKSQKSMTQIDNEVETSRKLNLEAIEIIFEQLKNYNKLLNERDLVENDTNGRTSKDIERSFNRFAAKREKIENKQAQFKADCKNSHDEYKIHQADWEEQQKKDEELRLKTDIVYALDRKHSSIPLIFHRNHAVTRDLRKLIEDPEMNTKLLLA